MTNWSKFISVDRRKRFQFYLFVSLFSSNHYVGISANKSTDVERKSVNVEQSWTNLQVAYKRIFCIWEFSKISTVLIENQYLLRSNNYFFEKSKCTVLLNDFINKNVC